MTTKSVQKILLSGGGTGGHIYPALSIAEALKAHSPDIVVEFVGSPQGLEQKIILKKGYKLHLMKIKPLHKSIGRIQQFLGLIQWPFVFLQGLWILLRFRPQVVMGFGGYASAPIVLIASLLRIRTALWEANVQPGIANKILAPWVRHCFVVFQKSQRHFPPSKTQCLGYPLRQSIETSFSPQTQYSEHRLKQNIEMPFSPKNKQTKLFLHCVLVFGGSQGAEIFNTIIPQICPQFSNIKFILQTGDKHFESVKEKFNEKNLEILSFLDPIESYYRQANLVICRSGAGTVAELTALGQLALFVPFSRAADNHQFKNAQVLQQKKSAFLIEEKDFNSESLLEFLNYFFGSMSLEEKAKMSENMRSLFKPQASQRITETLLSKKV